MYAGFFGLRCLPFEDRADTQFCCPNAQFDEAAAALVYEAQYGNGVALVLGEAGTGKTLLIRTVLARLEPAVHAVVLTWPGDSGADLIRESCKGFGVSLPSSQHQPRTLERLRRHLSRLAASGNRAILVLDQAENLSAHRLAQVATLSDLEEDRGRLLRVFLVAQPRLRSQMDRPELARLRQQLFGERVLTALTPEATRAYIAHRLSVAGASNARIFDDDAVHCIHELSGGIPRLINRICDGVMRDAYGAGVTRISKALVQENAGLSPADPAEFTHHAGAFAAAGPLAEPPLAEVERCFASTPDATEALATSVGASIERGLDAVERAEQRLSQVLDRTRREAGELDLRRSRVVEVTEDLADRAARLERTRESAEQVESRLAGAADAFADKADQVQAQLGRLIDGTLAAERVQAELQSATMRAAGASQDAEQKTHGLAEALKAHTAGIRQFMHEETTGLRTFLAEQTQQVEQSSQRLIDDATRRVRSMVERETDAAVAGAVRAMIAEHARQVEQATQQLVEDATRRARTAIEQETHAAQAMITSAMQRAGEALRDTQRTMADEALTRLRAALQHDLTAVETAASEAVVRAETKLDAMTQRAAQAVMEDSAKADALVERVKTVVEDAQGRLATAAAQTARLTEDINGLAAHRSALATAVGRLEEQTTDAEARTVQLGKAVERYPAAIDTLAAKANAAHDALEELVAHADEKIGRLASQHAAASSGIERLSAASAAAGQLLEHVGRESAALRNAVEQAEPALGRLAELKAITERAAPQCEMLGHLSTSADTMLAAMQRLRNDAEASIGRLSSHLTAQGPRLQAIEDGTSQAMARVESLAAQMDHLRQNAATLADQIENAIQTPNTVLEQVQAQTVQLERVFTAVRKVFAALSQATLDARRQGDSLQTNAAEFSEQFTRLTHETLRAGSVLREWSEEAVRAQTRLERTLEECPPLETTHPRELVHGVSHILDRLSPGATRELGTLGEPAPVEQVGGGATRRPLGRAEEIAKLITEASQNTVMS
jgi:general secretion pathway protein A